MQVFVIIGARGTGKSTFTLERVKNVDRNRLWAYDLEKRYYPDKRPLLKIKEFTEIAANVKNSVVVYEEATIFFPNRGSNKDLKETLVKSRYEGNIVFMVYHSICAVPYYVYELTDCVVLFRTKDEENRVIKKYEAMYPYFMKLKNKPHTCKQFKLLNGKYSPYEIIKL